jgi:hypothetical protein
MLLLYPDSRKKGKGALAGQQVKTAIKKLDPDKIQLNEKILLELAKDNANKYNKCY